MDLLAPRCGAIRFGILNNARMSMFAARYGERYALRPEHDGISWCTRAYKPATSGISVTTNIPIQ